MKLNSKLLFWIVIIFSIVSILDIITAMFILPGESNPIYLLTHSIFVLFILKFLLIGLVGFVYFKNEYPSKIWLYSFIYILIISIIMIGFGVFSNIAGILNPEIVQAAAQTTTSEKITYYGYIVGFFMIIPYCISMVAFKIYEMVEK